MIVPFQAGVVNFQPYRSVFLNLYGGSRTIFTCQENVPSEFAYPQRNWKEGPKAGLPVCTVRLPELVQRLQVSLLRQPFSHIGETAPCA